MNDVVIARNAIAQETQNHPAATPLEAWQAAARALVIRELLLQEARRLVLTPQPLQDDEGRRETGEEAL
ncbi:MAG: peptidylprolyl isomerase, partial [Beijerinckiaceae bacterium]